MIEPSATAILAATPSVLRALISSHDEAALVHPEDEGWSVRHVIAHILDVETVIYDDRITRILREERPFIRSIDPLARMDGSGLLEMLTGALVDEIELSRPPAVQSLTQLGVEQLGRVGDHDEASPITVSDLIHQWAYHDLMHLKQAASILQTPLVAGMGNTRKFYDL
jgi:hypothetical protein